MSEPSDSNKNRPWDVSRRGFLGTLGAGAVGAATLGGAAEAASSGVVAAGETVTISLKVNGVTHSLTVEPRATLLEVLRGPLGLKGSKPGCERGECGACTVLIGDTPRYACQTLAVEADGAAVTTVEGLLDGEELGEVQKAFVEEDAFQCGFCTSGQVMAMEGLLRHNKAPTTDQIRDGMSGNLCRCGAYAHIVKAAERAAAARRGGA
jgi:xanthine dehydrogenase YagT iron-sulfur-binding subunit